jgi:hypothetical protein
MMQRAGADPAADPVYIHKPSLMGAPWELRLRPGGAGMAHRPARGPHSYARVTRVRLSFRPVTMQTRRFLAEVWSAGGPAALDRIHVVASMVEQEAQDQAYGAFMRELHRRIAAAGATPAFDRGSPALLYWPGLAVLSGVVAGFAVLIVQALDIGAYGGAAVVRRLLCSVRRGRAARISGATAPAAIVPMRCRQTWCRKGRAHGPRNHVRTPACARDGHESVAADPSAPLALRGSRHLVSRCQTAQSSSFPRRVCCARVVSL